MLVTAGKRFLVASLSAASAGYRAPRTAAYPLEWTLSPAGFSVSIGGRAYRAAVRDISSGGIVWRAEGWSAVPWTKKVRFEAMVSSQPPDSWCLCDSCEAACPVSDFFESVAASGDAHLFYCSDVGRVCGPNPACSAGVLLPRGGGCAVGTTSATTATAAATAPTSSGGSAGRGASGDTDFSRPSDEVARKALRRGGVYRPGSAGRLILYLEDTNFPEPDESWSPAFALTGGDRPGFLMGVYLCYCASIASGAGAVDLKDVNDQADEFTDFSDAGSGAPRGIDHQDGGRSVVHEHRDRQVREQMASVQAKGGVEYVDVIGRQRGRWRSGKVAEGWGNAEGSDRPIMGRLRRLRPPQAAALRM